MSRRSWVQVATLALTLTTVPTGGALGQASTPGTSDLVGRLPATIEGAPVQVAFTQDMATWIDEAFAGEVYPELTSLVTALGHRGLSTADLTTTIASFGAEQDGLIQGFQLPGGDASTLSEAILDVYFIGFGELHRTDQTIAGQPVIMVSDGPLETAAYPYAVLLDRDVIWIASASEPYLHSAMGALVAVSAGTAPGNTGQAQIDPGAQAPEEWRGIMRNTLTWDQGAYVGSTSATFTGTWVRPVLSTVGYCESGCTAYIPAGTIDWTFESTAPGPPAGHATTSGSLPTGGTVVAKDQMLFLTATDPDHFRYWGSGTFFPPPQACRGREGAG